MTARIPHQLPVPHPDVRVPRGMWRRIAQAKVRDCFWLEQSNAALRAEIERLRAALAARGPR